MAYTAILYILLCLLVGFFGRWSRLGYWGVVLLSLAVTPALTAVCLLFFSDRSRPLTTPASQFKKRFNNAPNSKNNLSSKT